ncbi:MAG: hypothetical protein LUF68_09725, partial [Clostridiales bacterium]|nr:hypothetical protein [Clostridiales bacterium]
LFLSIVRAILNHNKILPPRQGGRVISPSDLKTRFSQIAPLWRRDFFSFPRLQISSVFGILDLSIE